MPRIVEEPPPKRPPYFWWLLANALALCFAVVSWTVCLHVFGNPEVPRNYRILKRIGRLPVLERFTVLEVPDGNLFGPKHLYSSFLTKPEKDLDRLNSHLMRNYLTNFGSPLSLTYIEGDYRVEQVRRLGGGEDFLPAGIAVRARAMVKPDDFTKAAPYPVVIEYLYPTEETAAARFFHQGDVLAVKKSPNCAAILHVARVVEDDEQRVCLTVVPIAYGPYRVGEKETFRIEPPAEVRPGAVFPVFGP